jgi:hypothetical protein
VLQEPKLNFLNLTISAKDKLLSVYYLSKVWFEFFYFYIFLYYFIIKY